MVNFFIVTSGKLIQCQVVNFLVAIHTYETTPATREAFASTNNPTIFDKNAVLLLALIGNAESVKFVLNDGSQVLLIERTRDWANEKMGEDVWESSSTFEKFTVLYTDVTNKLATPASLADLLVSGKKTNIQSVNDVPGTATYKKAEVNGEIYHIYEKNGAYYVEKPYQSVNEISKEIYAKILKAIADDSIAKMPEPPKITITAAGTEIDYTVGLNRWNNTFYDREGTFQTIMKGKAKTDLPYVKLNTELHIEFKGTTPDSVKLEDHILNADGNMKYKEIQTIPIEFKNDKGSFILVSNPAALLSSDSSDYEPGASIRGFRLICKWDENECEYAFIIRSNRYID